MNSPYQHGAALPSSLPSGYLQAAGDIGRQIGGGIASLGQGVAGAIEKYRQNEEERGILSGQVMGSIQDPTLLKYLDPEHVGSISKKIESGTVTNKDLKAFLPEVVIAEKRYNRDLQQQKLDSDLRTAQLNQQEAGLKIAAMQQDMANQKAFTSAFMGTPTSRTEQQTTTSPSITLNDINKYLQQGKQQDVSPEFLRNFTPMSMPQMQAPQPSASGVPAAPQAPAPAKVSGGNSANDAVADSIRAFGYGVANMFSPSSYFPGSSVGSDALAAYRPELTPQYKEQLANRLASLSDQNSPTAQALRAQLGAVQAQQSSAPAAPAPQAAAPQPANGLRFPATQPDLQPFNSQFPTVGRSGTTSTTQDVQVNLNPKERYASFLSNYVGQGGQVTPQFLQQAKDTFGVQPEVKLQTLADDNGKTLASAIFVDGKVHNIVPVPQMTPEQMFNMKQKVDGLTVNVGNQQFMAPTEKEAQDFRTASADLMNVGDKVKQLIALSDSAATRVPGTQEHAIAKQLVGELKPHLGKQMFSRLTELEFKSLDDVVSDPTKLFSLSSNTKTALSKMLAGQQQDLVNKAKSLGFNSLNSQDQNDGVTTKTVGGRQVQIRRF
jgi:hypothetical protein